MPVSVPTFDEFIGLHEEIISLEARVAALEAAATTPPVDPPIDPPPGGGNGGGKMVAVVTLANSGGTFSFYEASAQDIGAFHAPSGRFVMACRRLTVDGCPLRLDFRRIDGWTCVIFELGDVFDAPPPDLVQGYSVDILDDAGQHHTINVGAHYGLCRWRWQSGPWPHHRTVAEMVAGRDLPQFDAARAIGSQPLNPVAYEPLSFAGFTPYMPSTGGRPDIGQVTEYQGYALCTDDAGAWASVLAQGEAMNSWPFMMRDTQTGAPLDPIAYAHASYYEDNSTDPRLYSSQGVREAGIAIDPHHQPAGAYLPYLRTEDPYFLETLQCQSVRNFTDVPRGNPQMPGYDQVRGQAWSTRTLVQGWHATPESVPSWLLPKTVMQALLDQCAAALTWSIDRDDTLRTVFHLPDWNLNYVGNTPAGTCCALWQDDFVIGAWAWAAVLDSRFARFATFIANNALDRLGGTSGWPPGMPELYSFQVCDALGGPVYPSWQRAWEVNAKAYGLDPNDPPMQLRYTDAAEFDYPNGLLAALAMVEQARAAGVDLPDCSAILTFLCDALEEGARRVPASIYWRSAVWH